MSRIQPVDPANIQGPSKELLETIKAKLGRIPNIFKTMAHSPTALRAYLGLAGAFSNAVLPPAVREQIALTVGEDNQCQYCVSAHAAIGKSMGLAPEEITASRKGKVSDPKTNAILALAKKLSANRGNITDQELAEVRQAGCSDEEIIEIITAVALNIFTNYFNHVSDPAIDFPLVPPLP